MSSSSYALATEVLNTVKDTPVATHAFEDALSATASSKDTPTATPSSTGTPALVTYIFASKFTSTSLLFMEWL